MFFIENRENISNNFLIGTFIFCAVSGFLSGIFSVVIICGLVFDNTDKVLSDLNSDIASIVAENATLEEKTEVVDKYLTNASIAEEITSYSKTDTLYEVKIKGTTYKFTLNADGVTTDNTEGGCK